VPPLAALALSEASQGVKLAAISALGGIGSLTSFGPLSDLAAHPDPVLRAAAVAALGRLGDPRAIDVIRRGLEAVEDRVRAQAAIAAGLVGSLELAPALAERMEDPVWEVRYRAAEALHRLGMPGLALLSATAAGEGPGGEMARELLAEKGGIHS
jgi:HEAT repeat protein